jgi:hypothetical protein
MTSVDTSYPPPDTSVREYFTAKEAGIQTRYDQAARYASFFTALFDEAYAMFCPGAGTAADLRQQFMIERPERQNFYQKVVSEAHSRREKKNGIEVRIICNTRTPVD